MKLATMKLFSRNLGLVGAVEERDFTCKMATMKLFSRKAGDLPAARVLHGKA